MKLLQNKAGYIILTEISLNICSALKTRYLLQSNDFYLLAGKPLACLHLGWKIAVKLQWEGFSPLNICCFPGRLAAEAIYGGKKHLISCHKVCLTYLPGSEPCFDIKQNCSHFYLGFFFPALNLHARQEGAVTLETGGMLRGGRAAFRQTPFGKVGMEKCGLRGPEPPWKFKAGGRRSCAGGDAAPYPGFGVRIGSGSLGEG